MNYPFLFQKVINNTDRQNKYKNRIVIENILIWLKVPAYFL